MIRLLYIYFQDETTQNDELLVYGALWFFISLTINKNFFNSFRYANKESFQKFIIHQGGSFSARTKSELGNSLLTKFSTPSLIRFALIINTLIWIVKFLSNHLLFSCLQITLLTFPRAHLTVQITMCIQQVRYALVIIQIAALFMCPIHYHRLATLFSVRTRRAEVKN